MWFAKVVQLQKYLSLFLVTNYMALTILWTADRLTHLLYDDQCHLKKFSESAERTNVNKVQAWIDANSHWSHLFDISLLCVFRYLLKLPASENAKSHWSHIQLSPMFESQTGCTVFTCLHCAFSNVSSNCLPNGQCPWKCSHIFPSNFPHFWKCFDMVVSWNIFITSK